MRLQADARKSRVEFPSAHFRPTGKFRLHWDHRSRSLTAHNQIVKSLRCPARNQEIIFAAFQEDGWQTCILDPLPPRDGIDPKRRLKKAIEKLNNGLAPVLHFYGNGNGRGICWRWTEHAADLLRQTTAPRRRVRARKKGASKRGPIGGRSGADRE